jgi:hypothetical protein
MADNTENLGEEKRISEDILDISNKLVSSLKERFKLGAQVNENERLLFGVSKQLQQTSLSLTSSLEKRNNFTIKSKDLAKEIIKLETNKEKSLDLQRRTAAALKQDQSDYTKQALKAAADLKNTQQKLNEAFAEQDAIKSKLARARGAELVQLKEDLTYNKSKVSELEKQSSRLETYKNKQKDLAKVTVATINAQKAGIKATEDEIIKLNKELELRKKIEKSLGLTGGLIEAISKIPGIGKYLKADEAKKDMEDLAIAMQKQGKDVSSFGNKAQIAFAGLKTLAKGFGEALLSPEAILTFLATQINKADKQATALGKSLGVSKDQARALREEFVKYSANTNDAFITTDRLLKAQTELSEQLGIAVQFSGEELSNFAKLTEIVGLSAQEAGKLASFSAAAGIGTKDYIKQIRASSFAAQQTNKVHFSDKLILQDISKLSAGILVKFQNNPKALAAAVVQTKALGLSLEQVDKIGDSLLNFESSIENELKAQLLTGKQLNLDKARYLALTGSQAELAQEISSQAGSLADFENMNVIAQKSLAEAFGMSRDELADMLLKQEAINTYGDKAAKLNAQQLKDQKASGLSLDDYLKKQAEQQSVQDKFNNAIEKLQDLIGNLVAGPLGGFIDSLSNGLNIVTKIFAGFAKIASIVKGLFGDGIGEALGKTASVAAIGGIGLLMARSLTKGTTLNPMIVKDISAAGDTGGFSGGAGRIGKAFSKGGIKGGGKAMGRILKSTLKGNVLTALAMGVGDAAMNMGEGKGVGESLGRAGITGLTSLIGGGLGSLIAPGAGTIGGGIAGGMAGDWLGNKIFGEKQPVEDGIAPSNQGPFTIRNKYGQTAVTAVGDNIAVSPNMSINRQQQPTNTGISKEDVTAIVSNLLGEFNKGVNAIVSRPSVAIIDGRDAFIRDTASNQNFGTYQGMNTSYLSA